MDKEGSEKCFTVSDRSWLLKGNLDSTWWGVTGRGVRVIAERLWCHRRELWDLINVHKCVTALKFENSLRVRRWKASSPDLWSCFHISAAGSRSPGVQELLPAKPVRPQGKKCHSKLVIFAREFSSSRPFSHAAHNDRCVDTNAVLSWV